ncbi:hypothetical protein CO230_10750 [Chryseobacterium sp. 6424]|uniref:hypothetical protein n=1 Tax=Chryseobacterium sp. 6424 TaxID=2039166 RepID=UPI000EFA71A5|nr:hypothetical protein [Chryseobacterium sp. 6424]AYO58550.1 hypothetical protein CO230_10750 [Chryseobacterium sp. 6424]
MKSLLVSIFILFEGLAFSQVGNENISFSSGTFFMKANRPTTIDHVVEGNPYINSKDFKQVLIDGYSLNVQKLRYNAYEDEMEFEDASEIYYANKQEGLKIVFTDNKKTYQILNYSLDNKHKFGYLVLLYEHPNISLFKREKVELLKGEKSPSAFGKDANDYYAQQRDVYIIRKGTTYFKFPKNGRDFVKILSVDKSSFENFLETNKLSFSREEDIIEMMEYINN